MMLEKNLSKIHADLKTCQKCQRVCGTPVHGPPVTGPIMLIGQAPGVHEASRGRPFAHTAGKTLFKWLGSVTGSSEEDLRELIYFAAVARCFPGKALKGGGDREPDREEIENCRPFLVREVQTIKPKLILAVGRLAISEVLGARLFPRGTPLADVVGKTFELNYHGVKVEVLPLPHPSGVSRWPQTEPGKTKLTQALKIFAEKIPEFSA
jgi:uracil-DNA glycosylase